MTQLVYASGDHSYDAWFDRVEEGKIKHSSHVDHSTYGQLARNNFQHWWFTIKLLIDPHTNEKC